MSENRAKIFSTADLSSGAEAAGALGALNHYNFERPSPFDYIATSEVVGGLKFGPPSDDFLRLPRPEVKGFEVFYAGPSKKWALRAQRSIAEDSVLFEYGGQLSEDRDEPVEQDDYLFTFDYQNRHFLLDACRRGNLARFVNHSCVPNCYTRLALFGDNVNSDWVPHLLICASRNLIFGEEITLDYGDAWWSAKRATTSAEGNFYCLCKMDNCRYRKPADG